MLEIAMKDNEKRELVSRITAVALEYRDAEQLRERIRDAVLPAIDAAEAAERERIAELARSRPGWFASFADCDDFAECVLRGPNVLGKPPRAATEE